LNRVLCQHHGVRVAGIVVNRVIPEKYEQTKKYMTKALQSMWGIPLLGCIPDKPFLGYPALADIEKLYGTKVITEREQRTIHFDINKTKLVTTSLSQFVEYLRNTTSNALFYCHWTRTDVILAFLEEFQNRKERNAPFDSALVVCGREKEHLLPPEVQRALQSVSAPVLSLEITTHCALQLLHAFTPKFNIHDEVRVEACIDHYERYIDVDELLRRTRSDRD